MVKAYVNNSLSHYLRITIHPNSEMKGIMVKSANVQKVLPISTYCGGCARLSRFFRSSIVVGLVLLRTKRTLAMPSYSKGQLNSEWIYEVIISPKMPTKKFPDFCPIKQTRIVALFWWSFGECRQFFCYDPCLFGRAEIWKKFVGILGEMMTS